MLGDYWVPSRENIITMLYKRFLIASIEMGYNIVVDNMNLSAKTCKYIEDLVKIFNDDPLYNHIPTYIVEYKDFSVDLDECIRRDSLRPNPIGEKVITDTYNRYKETLEKWKQQE